MSDNISKTSMNMFKLSFFPFQNIQKVFDVIWENTKMICVVWSCKWIFLINKIHTNCPPRGGGGGGVARLVQIGNFPDAQLIVIVDAVFRWPAPTVGEHPTEPVNMHSS